MFFNLLLHTYITRVNDYQMICKPLRNSLKSCQFVNSLQTLFGCYYKVATEVIIGLLMLNKYFVKHPLTI